MKWEVRAAWIMLTGSGVCWPLSQLTWARDEPPTTLALSWLALLYASFTALIAARTHKDQKDSDENE